MLAAGSDDLVTRVGRHVSILWPTAPNDLAQRLIDAVGITGSTAAAPTPSHRWTERDVVLITYGDSILDGDRAPLAVLNSLISGSLAEAVGMVHILPFAPSSSDRGFAVIDYHAVDPELGTWADLDVLGESADLMFDLVVNHASSQSVWAQQFREDREPGRDFIRIVKSTDDLSKVVRPRSLPLVTEVETVDGPRDVWTTFSDDQYDLDWDNPELACAMLQVIDRYLSHGARFLRLDAIAYLGKQSGTSCVHLPRTHELVRLMHTLLAVRAPHVAVVTETNVPDWDNRSYFGDGDEAHLIYNFTLPPLLVDAILNGRADRLSEWLRHVPNTPPDTTMFNFVSSHDGIGVRPAEGILSDHEIEDLVATAHARGGRHGTYDTPAGPRPYELNIALPDLFGGMDDQLMPARVLLAHDVMFSMAGVPAVYANSLFATTNDHAAVERDHVRRSINRGSVSVDELAGLEGARLEIFTGLVERMTSRRNDPTLHPEGAQSVRHEGPVLIVERTSVDGTQTRTFFHNFSSSPQHVDGINLAPYESGTRVAG